MTKFFKQNDWQVFTSINTLPQKAGVPKEQLLQLVAKELTDNALDACEGLPGAEVIADYISFKDRSFFIEDNGKGIPGDDSQIAELFSVNRPLISTKRVRLPRRGALGNGLRVVAGLMFSLDGQIKISTRGRTLLIKPGDDGQAVAQRIGEYDSAGTRIEFYVPDAGFKYDPLGLAQEAITANIGDYYKGKTSPFWYDSDSFFALLQAAPDDMTVRDFLTAFDGCTGRKAGQIAAGFDRQLAKEISFEDADQLLARAREMAKPVSHRRIGTVGAEIWDAISYRKEEAVFKVQPGRGTLPAEIPAIVEVWAIPGQSDQALINKTPIAGDLRIRLYKSGYYFDGCNLSIGGGKKFKNLLGYNRPGFWINVNAPYIPITTDGKEPDFEQVQEQIHNAFLKVARDANKDAAPAKKERRSMKEIVYDVLDDCIDEASAGGRMRYSPRQLFYKVRPYILGELEKEPDYNYFCSIITDIENERGGDLPGIYRKERGVIVQPFSRERIELGTRNVEQYQRPEYEFNKVLYIEKEGQFELLLDAKIPERYDLVLMTSEGFASRAARDFIDLIGETSEPVQFFCIHDFDAAGTMIYDTLVNATRARGARTVEVIDLGLTYEDAERMNLQSEKIKTGGRRRAVGSNYSEDAEWLQYQRVELDAMDSQTFVNWLTEKLDQYHDGKLIPPDDYLDGFADDQLNEQLRALVKAEVEKEFDLESITDERLEERLPHKVKALEACDLVDLVKRSLDKNPARNWREPVIEEVEKILDGQADA